MRLNQFRQHKALNETGSKQGQYYLKRFDYFEFYSYPGIKKHLLICVIVCLVSLHLIVEGLREEGLLSWGVVFFSCYFAYLSGLTGVVLYRRVCRFRSYFFFPKKWYTHLYAIRKEIDLSDFDSIATLNHHEHKHNR
jgi:hypothetical protein